MDFSGLMRLQENNQRRVGAMIRHAVFLSFSNDFVVKFIFKIRYAIQAQLSCTALESNVFLPEVSKSVK